MTDLNFENNRLMDVVSENEEIIDSKTRTEIHNLGLLHREVHVWLLDNDNNIFFQKRGLHSASAGLLDATVGGHLNKGEGYMEAAIRETKEETGISLAPTDLVLLRKFKNSHLSKDYIWGTTNNFIRAIYVCKDPIEGERIKKETGIPGGGFQKLSSDFLLDPSKEYIKMFTHFILTEELPYILKYLKSK